MAIITSVQNVSIDRRYGDVYDRISKTPHKYKPMRRLAKYRTYNKMKCQELAPAARSTSSACDGSRSEELARVCYVQRDVLRRTP